MKPSLIRLVALTAFFSLGPLLDHLTWEFSLARHKISGPLLSSETSAFPCNQTWTLSAKGGQSYVFFSQDGAYVLKFFKDQPRPYLKWPAYLAQKNKKLARTLSGYTLFQQRCPEISASLLLHFEPTSSPLPAILIDRCHISHSVDLSSYLFVLQERVVPLKKPSSLEEKQNILTQVSTLLQTVAKAHLKDHDPRLHLNLGYLGEQLVVTDPGRIALSSDDSFEMTKKLLNFIEN
jgi:hypothetical protein